MQTLLQDLRFGARVLLKNYGFTIVAVLTLSLGIGATTAIFSVVNAVLLRPLPYPDAERILHVGQHYSGNPSPIAAGEPKFLFWREHNQSFAWLAAYQYVGAGFNLAGGNEAEFVTAIRASEDFFRVLGVGPIIGRGFTADEDRPDGARAVIVSDSLWQRRFGADPALIGQTMQLNEQSYTVVGVLPPDFRLLPAVDLIVPMRASLVGDPNPNQTVIGRLKPGVTPAQAQAEMQLLADKFRAAYPNQMRPQESAGVQPYQALFVTGSVRQMLWLLLGAVALLLLIACANVANLQLTRANARSREVAIRRALGAASGRIVRQLLTEGVLLAVVGGTLGLLLAVWGVDVLLAAMPEGLIPRYNAVEVDWRVLLFALTASVGTGLLFGLAPALQATRIDVNTALKESAGKGQGSSASGRLRSVLIVVEIALSLILLIGSTLLIRTFANLRGVAPGFDPRGVLSFRLSPQGERYDTAAETAEFNRALLERLRGVPGVEAAATINILPLTGQFNMAVSREDQPDQFNSTQFRVISPDYFRVLKMSLRQGRAFTEQDKAGAPGVVIVNEAFARRHLSPDNPFAQRLLVGRGTGDEARQIVGVVGDAKQFGLNSDAPPMVFVPYAQLNESTLKVLRRFLTSIYVVRTTGEPLSYSAAIKREVAALDPTLPPTNLRALEQIVARSIAPQRFNMLLLSLFAGLGLLLAAIGIYGVISYHVAQRTHEMGIRIALGAQRGDVIKLVLKHGLALAAIGVAAGLAGAYGLTRLLQGFLFGVTTTDPLTFAGVALLLLIVALLACYLPARRATKVDPLTALRYE